MPEDREPFMKPTRRKRRRLTVLRNLEGLWLEAAAAPPTVLFISSKL